MVLGVLLKFLWFSSCCSQNVFQANLWYRLRKKCDSQQLHGRTQFSIHILQVFISFHFSFFSSVQNNPPMGQLPPTAVQSCLFFSFHLTRLDLLFITKIANTRTVSMSLQSSSFHSIYRQEVISVWVFWYIHVLLLDGTPFSSWFVWLVSFLHENNQLSSNAKWKTFLWFGFVTRCIFLLVQSERQKICMSQGLKLTTVALRVIWNVSSDYSPGKYIWNKVKKPNKIESTKNFDIYVCVLFK